MTKMRTKCNVLYLKRDVFRFNTTQLLSTIAPSCSISVLGSKITRLRQNNLQQTRTHLLLQIPSSPQANHRPHTKSDQRSSNKLEWPLSNRFPNPFEKRDTCCTYSNIYAVDTWKRCNYHTTLAPAWAPLSTDHDQYQVGYEKNEAI